MADFSPLPSPAQPITDKPINGSWYRYIAALDRTVRNFITTVGTAVQSTRKIVAGNGLTGGGDLSADRTLNIGEGTGIQVNADSIEVKYGTVTGTATQGDDSRITGALQKSNNLSDLGAAATARTNLGLGSAAVMTGPAGAIVGTTDVQALTHKDLTDATNAFPTFNQDTTGNAATATKLQTARDINGVAFDGSSAITIADATKLAIADNLADLNNTATARTNLGVAIGTDVQAHSADLDGLLTAWTAYTPAVSAGSGSFTTVSASGKYKKVGKLVLFTVTVTITNNGTASSNVTVTNPFSTSGTPAAAYGRETAATGKMLQGVVNTTNTNIYNYDNTYPGVSGASLTVSGFYESA